MNEKYGGFFFGGIIILVLALAVVGYYLIDSYQLFNTATDTNEDDTSFEEELVKETVIAFGQKLKNVPLSAPQDMVKQAVEDNYTMLITPELLAAWEVSSTSTPGRLTSSPWPDRIEIQSITKNADGSYTVYGSLVEVTSKEVVNGGAYATYPITARLLKRGDSWLISSYEEITYAGS